MNIVPSTVNVGIHMFTVYMYNSVPRNRRYAIIWGKTYRVHFESQESIIVYFTIKFSQYRVTLTLICAFLLYQQYTYNKI